MTPVRVLANSLSDIYEYYPVFGSVQLKENKMYRITGSHSLLLGLALPKFHPEQGSDPFDTSNYLISQEATGKRPKQENPKFEYGRECKGDEVKR